MRWNEQEEDWGGLGGEGRAMFRVFSVPNALGLELILVASGGSWHWDILGHYSVTGPILLITVTSALQKPCYSTEWKARVILKRKK